MNLRHAAALALAGWYLMIPSSTFPPDVAYKEPLRNWRILRSFDTADDCQDFLSNFFEQSREQKDLNTLDPAYRDFMFAECIATDDPRLNAK